jgi:hypothetical protein
MQDLLQQKLHTYLIENNPEVLVSLQDEKQVTAYLKEKVSTVEDLITQLQEDEAPAYIIEDMCMDRLTEDLRPSRFNYLCSILQEHFESTYDQLQEDGTLTYEVINLITVCQPVFDTVGFTADIENNEASDKAICSSIRQYLQSK